MSRDYRGYDEEARPPRRSGSPGGNLGRRPPRPRDEEGAMGYPPPRRSYGSGADMGGPPPRGPYGSGPDWPGEPGDERWERPPRRPRPARPDGEPELRRRRPPRPGPEVAARALPPRGGKHQRLYRYLSLLGAMLFSSLGGITLSLNQLVVGILVLALSLPCAVLFWYF